MYFLLLLVNISCMNVLVLFLSLECGIFVYNVLKPNVLTNLLINGKRFDLSMFDNTKITINNVILIYVIKFMFK